MLNAMTTVAFVVSLALAVLKLAGVSAVAAVSWWMVILLTPAVFFVGLTVIILSMLVLGLIIGIGVWLFA